MLRPLALAVAALSLAACDGATLELQRQFETAALTSPIADITRTNGAGRVVSTDADDWRIGPSYLNVVTVVQLPFPNPVERGEPLRFTVDVVTGVPGGLRAFVLATDPLTGRLEVQPIRDPGADCPDAAASGICQFVISAAQIGLSGPGLYRLLLLDGRDGVVSYGDVDVR